MLKLDLFKRRNFAVGNARDPGDVRGARHRVLLPEHLSPAGRRLQRTARAGFATLPVTLVMFALSRRFGALADRYGPRLFMGAGPLVAAAGLLLLLRTGIDTSYVEDLLPALLLFALGLSMTVCPARRRRARRCRRDGRRHRVRDQQRHRPRRRAGRRLRRRRRRCEHARRRHASPRTKSPSARSTRSS